MKYQRLLTIILECAAGFVGSTCLALQTYPFIDQQSTNVTISQSEQNRIAVLGDRIQQVFGADGAFDVESDEEGGQIFLIAAKSRLSLVDSPAVIKPMTITIITETGLTQDLKLIPKDIEAQSILLKPTLLPIEEVKTKDDHLQQVMALFKAMVNNEELEGYTKTSLENKPPLLGQLNASNLDEIHELDETHAVPRSSLRVLEEGEAIQSRKKAGLLRYTRNDDLGTARVTVNNIHSIASPSLRFAAFKSLKVKEVALYKGEKYQGKIYTLHNEGNKPLFLKESDLLRPGDSALSLSKRRIHKGETIILYVVSRRGL